MTAEPGETQFVYKVIEVYGQAFWGIVEPLFLLLIDYINICHCLMVRYNNPPSLEIITSPRIDPVRVKNRQILLVITL